MRRYYLGLLFILICTALLFTCQEKKESSPFRNIQNPDAAYVGMNECKNCHLPIYKTYLETGMGQSWGLATKEKSAADFSDAHPPIYDKKLDLYYKAFWRGEDMYIKEYRLSANDTTHYREEKVSYVVGSGQHTNSHIVDFNGYLHQAPITFYTQKGQWDLAPGYEGGNNIRFDRKIQTECITCHNGYPKHIEGSLNKYAEVKTGIDCERCHGPGSIHVAEKKLGKLVDTSKGADYSIVNPKRLTTEEQNNLCQRCHLQGIAVLNDDKNFFDFLPSQKLQNVMSVFMPTFSGSQKHMIMASHVERMKMSDCFVTSGKMSCVTCHNPHLSVKATPKETFNAACKNCHSQQSQCTESLEVRQSKKDDCSGCHMAKNSSIDIPHVAVTDHFIRRTPTIENEEAIRNFIGLKSYNNEDPNARTKARAFLEFYERYQPNPLLLDSALAYLAKADKRAPDGDVIRSYFLKENYQKVIEQSEGVPPSKLTSAWTAYRIGESFSMLQNFEQAVAFHRQAIELMPLGLDFRLKLASALVATKNYDEAKKMLRFILKENIKYDEAHKVLGFLALQENNNSLSAKYTRRAIALNPNDEQAYINLAVANYKQQNLAEVKKILLKASTIFPKNKQIRAMLQDL
jgi:hypothetical protein